MDVLKKKYSDAALKLSKLIKNGIRTLIIIDLVSLVMYLMYRSVYTQTTIYERTNLGFFIAGQMAIIVISIFFIHMPEYSSAILDLMMFFAFLNFGESVVEVVNALNVNFMTETIIITFTFLAINIVFLSIILIMRTAKYEAWDKYRDMVNDGVFDIWDRFRDMHQTPYEKENIVFSSVDTNNVYFKNPTMCGAIFTLLPVEVTLLYFYVLFMVSEPSPPASGWFFCLHIFTISATLAWFLGGGNKREIKRTESWMFQTLLLVIAVDLTQLVFLGSKDVPEVIGIRILLLIVVLVYLGVLMFAMAMDKYRESAELKARKNKKKALRTKKQTSPTMKNRKKGEEEEDITTDSEEEGEEEEEEQRSSGGDDNDEFDDSDTVLGISKPTLMFYFYQYIVPSVGVCDILFVALYFAFVSAMHLKNPMWWNTVHVFDGIIAILCSIMGSAALDCTLILAVTATLTLIYDIMIVGLMQGELPVEFSTEYVIEAFFIIFDVIYLISFGVTWINATLEDAEKYEMMANRDKIVAFDLFVMTQEAGKKTFNWKSSIRPKELANVNDASDVQAQVEVANKKKKKEDQQKSAEQLQAEKDDDLLLRSKKNAEKIYYVIVVFIRNVFILESVNFIFFTLILADGTYRWYEWFYLVHGFTIMTAIVCMTFELNTKVALSFLMGFAFLDAATDGILIAVLASTDSLNDGKMTIRSLFIVSDFFYLLFAGLLVGLASQPDYAALMYMHSLGNRIRAANS